MEKISSGIIPGLIDDMGRECLIRLPYQVLPTACSVCKTWRAEITSLEFPKFRRLSGMTRPIIIIAQAQMKGSKNLGQDGVKQNDNPSRPTYQLTLSNPETRIWTRLSVNPGGLPMFCGLVESGSDILVIGGLDPVTWQVSSDVWIYSLLFGKWRKGADMPGVIRSFFGCATSDNDRRILVAGGHDEDKNALRSALLYAVDKDEWVPLPDMERARDECKVIFHRGKFHVISGYQTDMQGCFERSAEVFDTSTWQWDPIVEEFLEASASPRSCVTGSNGRVYACLGRRSGNVAVQIDNKWRVIAKVPADVRSSQWVGAYGANKMLVIGSSRIGGAHNGYMLDLKSYKWSKVDVPMEFCGHVQSGCVLEI